MINCGIFVFYEIIVNDIMLYNMFVYYMFFLLKINYDCKI